MTGPSPLERFRGPLVAAVTVGAIAARVALVLRQDGLLYPDEVFQTLEQGHRLAFGYGLVPWEFEVGARPWLLPALVAAAMRAGDWVGLAPELAGRLLFALASGATAWACARLVRAWDGGAAAQVLAAAAWAVLNLGVLLGARGLSESAATLPLVSGLALALDRTRAPRAVAWGAALVGVAVVLRLQVGVFAAALPLTLWARGERRRAAQALGVLAAAALAYGLLDLATWGSFFHSAREYLRFNLMEGRASSFGTAPPSFYSGRLLASAGPLFVGLCLSAAAGARRAPALAAMTAAYFALHLATPHKELRFLLPALPLLTVLAGLGVEVLWRWRRAAGQAAAVALAALFSVGQPAPASLTFRQLGLAAADRDVPALDDGGPVNRLLALAGRRAELCGLEVRGRELGYTGGLTWLHRQVPLYDSAAPPPPGAVNAAITSSPAPGEEVLARDGAWALVRTGARCVAAPWAPQLR